MQLKLKCLQIDLARQKETVAFVKSYADFAAKYGYNALILYLENAVRTPSVPFFREEDTYSAEEITEIVNYAERLGLDVIPALENLGHLEKFFLYPELEDLSEITDVTTQGRGFDRYPRGACGCVTNPRLNEFFDRYITEVCSLFHSEYVHMGLDEPFDLAVCDRCKAAMVAGTDKSELFLGHILHTYRLCKKMGKTMMMWDDFFEYADIVERLPRDIVLCNWNYVFVGDEPQGHWTNRVKKDWFRLYDELGFRYLFCVYAHRASSAYNVDTFSDYAAKYHPVGAVMTTWRRSDSFYQGAYPVIAYAGMKWSGRADTYAEKTDVYAAVLGGNRGAAELVASMNVVECGSLPDVARACENDYFLKLIYRNALKPVTDRLSDYAQTAEGEARDILTDIFDYTYEIYLTLSLQKIAVELYDGYETKTADRDMLIAQIDGICAGFDRIRRNGDALWKKYRRGIRSFLGRYENKFREIKARLEEMKGRVRNGLNQGVLYAELMLYDPYPTVRNEISVRYADGTEACVYRGSLKPSVALFEWGGCYGYRFPVREVPIEYVEFTVFGEGALYPTHFRYVANGVKYVASRAETVCGKVSRVENLLFDDTRFAEMGTDDGIAHFNDIALSKERHTVRVYFRRLTEGLQ